MSLDDYREHLDFKTRMDRLKERTAKLRIEEEGDTDEERRAVDYGLIARGDKEMTARHQDNVINVDFANRARAPRVRRTRDGR